MHHNTIILLIYDWLCRGKSRPIPNNCWLIKGLRCLLVKKNYSPVFRPRPLLSKSLRNIFGSLLFLLSSKICKYTVI